MTTAVKKLELRAKERLLVIQIPWADILRQCHNRTDVAEHER